MNISNDTWFTYSAQIINFLILVWLLRRFLYRPVLQAIEKREQGFTLREKEASKVEAEALELLEDYHQRLNALENSRETMMAQVQEEVTEWKSEQIEQAKEEVAQARQRWHSAYQRERERILRTMKESVGLEVQEMAKVLLRELTNCDLESLMIDVFLKNFAESPEGLSRFRKAMMPDQRLRIRSAFPISEDSQKRMMNLLNEKPETSSSLIENWELIIDTDLICGIELVYGDHRWSWSLAQSLDELEHRLESLLNSGAAQPYLAGETSA